MAVLVASVSLRGDAPGYPGAAAALRGGGWPESTPGSSGRLDENFRNRVQRVSPDVEELEGLLAFFSLGRNVAVLLGESSKEVFLVKQLDQ